MPTGDKGETHVTRHGDTRARCMRVEKNEGETQVARADEKESLRQTVIAAAVAAVWDTGEIEEDEGKNGNL